MKYPTNIVDRVPVDATKRLLSLKIGGKRWSSNDKFKKVKKKKGYEVVTSKW
jgi:hypothetical protein